ncbi:guanine deaminase [Elaphomyces granulatus]
MMPSYTLFYGTFIHLPRASAATSKHVLSINHGALWVSGADGCIIGFNWTIACEDELDAWLERKGWKVVDDLSAADCRRDGGEAQLKPDTTVVIVKAKCGQNGFFFPGFIDTHIHASQYPNSGIFGSSTLLDWLETYTFPLEASFEDVNKARATYERVISRTLSHGTTCAAYFATIHVPATNLLASLCHSRGQRAFIGRVCMDNPDICPAYYHDASADESIKATEATISHIQSIDPKGRLIAPIITPRFAPTCSFESMTGLGRLAASFNPPLHIQTHLSENKKEIALVKELFPQSSSYTQVYDGSCLLTPRTILAHAVHLSPEERVLIRSRGSKISHCPASNTAIGSGLCSVRTLLDDGLTVGLGTDVSAGYSSSILVAVRQACLVSRLITYASSDESRHANLSAEDALYLATRGGAQVVDMADKIGGFDIGMFWDAQLIELGPSVNTDPDGDTREADQHITSNVDIFGWESWEERIAKWVWNGDDRNVKAVWVNGRLVHARK